MLQQMLITRRVVLKSGQNMSRRGVSHLCPRKKSIVDSVYTLSHVSCKYLCPIRLYFLSEKHSYYTYMRVVADELLCVCRHRANIDIFIAKCFVGKGSLGFVAVVCKQR
jgi:hypothetical protein